MSSENLNETAPWQALEAHQQDFSSSSLNDLFDQDTDRFAGFHAHIDGLLFDYSKTHVNKQTLTLLETLAKARDLEGWREKMFSGAALNSTEGRAVLHCALRGSTHTDLQIDGENVSDFVNSTCAHMKILSEKIRNHPQITDVINIGIGGSDLGPRMVCKALTSFEDGPRVHFISNVDGRALLSRLKKLKPENTAMLITSKTFTTLETLSNAKTAKDWLLNGQEEEALKDRLFAVSTNIEAATNFGVPQDHILPMRDWVGGRFSLWGGVGLSIAISFGFERFQQLLDGAKAMDTHFQTAPFTQNIPMLLAMIGVWYRNFWHITAKAILPYSHDLRDLPKYLQQLDMESNGKSATRDGEEVCCATGPVIFGEAGTNAQHAFMQLLHQSEDMIPADFIVVATPGHDLEDHHIKLNANALAQSQALMRGAANAGEPHRHFEGNRPSTTLVLDRLDAYHLGMVLALYEHVIFVQGIIWGINSFDQWGVELGKVLAKPLIGGFAKSLEHDENAANLDSSTLGLLHALQQKQR